ncbi:uncharacterized protein LOC129597335 [Paramacrobiotus metropolitanus]|uniref:uncharacterized protein LOC129597335 n=1 Tax=Paramacrobiotus metropolitanus TaxID=2943436 RepID=UPI00244586E7|nr:uncharacterized protein LOC129597335 [Paramacrobiotus metropolitanus]
MVSQGPTSQSTKARFTCWIRNPWKSQPLLGHRSRDVLRVDPPVAARETIADDSNCRQILGKNLQPVVHEFAAGQSSLGYLCDVDWAGRRVLVDFVCHNRPPRWLPVRKVRRHTPVCTNEIRPHIPVEVALRPNSNQPFVFQPAQIIFPAARDSCGNFGPICVETTCSGSIGLIRKFVHPVQVRIVPTDPENHQDTDESFSFAEYGRLLQRQTASLDCWQDAANIDLRHLLRRLNEISWMKVLRIWLDTEGIHCIYINKPGVFVQLKLEYLVQRSRSVERGPPPDSENTDTTFDRSVTLGTLPYELHEWIVLEIKDIHSVFSAQKVCKTWHDILNGRRGNQHVAVDLTNLLLDGPNERERKYSRTHLLNDLDNAVTTATVSLTLMNGNLSPELDLYVFQFLSIKVTRLPIVVLRNVRCFRAVAQNVEKQRLEWANLSYLMQACQVLHLRNVTIPTVFGPIAGLWCAPAGFREDVDIVVKKAALYNKFSATERLRQFLQVLNAGCPDLSALETNNIDEACREIIMRPEHSLCSRLLLMLTLLNEPLTGQLQPPLCSLAALAFRYSYPMKTASRSCSRHQARAISRDPPRMDGVWDIPERSLDHGVFREMFEQHTLKFIRTELDAIQRTDAATVIKEMVKNIQHSHDDADVLWVHFRLCEVSGPGHC